MIGDLLLHNNIRNVLDDGVWDENPRPVWEDTKEPAHSKFITHVNNSYDISKGEFPITETKPTFVKSAINELLWMFQEQSNDLTILREKYNVHWWDNWDIGDGTIGERYGGTIKKHDLVNKLLKGIKENPYSRRHIIDLWQEEDFASTEGLNPCFVQYIFSVRGDKLDLMLTQRSSDLIASSNIDATQAVALLMMVASDCGLTPGKFTWNVANMHIYDRHIEIAKEIINRDIRTSTPMLVLKEQKSFYDFTVNDFELVDYKAQGKFRIPLAV